MDWYFMLSLFKFLHEKKNTMGIPKVRILGMMKRCSGKKRRKFGKESWARNLEWKTKMLTESTCVE